MFPSRIRGVSVRDVRFPETSSLNEQQYGHHCCTYVILYTDCEMKAHGFSCHRSVDNISTAAVAATKVLSKCIMGKQLTEIYNNFNSTIKTLRKKADEQWGDHEKDTGEVALAALLNTLWDLWGRIQYKPVWKVLVDLNPEELVRVADFSGLEDIIDSEEAMSLLGSMKHGTEDREKKVLEEGYPSFIHIEKHRDVSSICSHGVNEGWNAFQFSVDSGPEEASARLSQFRDAVGYEPLLLLDLTDLSRCVDEANFLSVLVDYKPFWISGDTELSEEGQRQICRAIAMKETHFCPGKQVNTMVGIRSLLLSEEVSFLALNIGWFSVSQLVAIYLLCKKLNVHIWPHAKGVGLFQMASHLQIWDYISVSGSAESRAIEYGHRFKHVFKLPVKQKHGQVRPPTSPGYGTEIWEKLLINNEYPYGEEWKAHETNGDFQCADQYHSRSSWLSKRASEGAYIQRR